MENSLATRMNPSLFFPEFLGCNIMQIKPCVPFPRSHSAFYLLITIQCKPKTFVCFVSSTWFPFRNSTFFCHLNSARTDYRIREITVSPNQVAYWLLFNHEKKRGNQLAVKRKRYIPTIAIDATASFTIITSAFITPRGINALTSTMTAVQSEGTFIQIYMRQLNKRKWNPSSYSHAKS